MEKRTSLELWCAAAATGEEPYSLLFTMLDYFAARSPQPECRVLATDISTRALKIAQEGVFSAERFAETPRAWKTKYLLQGQGRFDGFFRVRPEVARNVEFRKLNLVEPFNPGRSFPLIACRNAMIYFDRPTQERVVTRLALFLEPAGYLFIGHSESVTNRTGTLRFVRPAIYQKHMPTSVAKESQS